MHEAVPTRVAIRLAAVGQLLCDDGKGLLCLLLRPLRTPHSHSDSSAMPPPSGLCGAAILSPAPSCLASEPGRGGGGARFSLRRQLWGDQWWLGLPVVLSQATLPPTSAPLPPTHAPTRWPLVSPPTAWPVPKLPVRKTEAPTTAKLTAQPMMPPSAPETPTYQVFSPHNHAIGRQRVPDGVLTTLGAPICGARNRK